jgi:hypothetical protein
MFSVDELSTQEVKYMKDLVLEDLTTAQLWQALDPETRTHAAESLYADKALRREGDHAIATQLRFREVAVRKLPIDQRVSHLLRSVRPDDSLAATLLLALHMGDRRPLLEAFLTELDIPHQGGIIDEDHELTPPDPDHLTNAVSHIYDNFPDTEVTIYLTTLHAMDPASWSRVAPLIRHQE